MAVRQAEIRQGLLRGRGQALPWWTVSFSVVATETSVLTVISVPGGAYSGQGFGNVELALGHVIGRVIVAASADRV